MNNFITLEVVEFLDEIWRRTESLYKLDITEQKNCNWNTINLAEGGIGIGCNGHDFFCIRDVDFIVPITANVYIWNDNQAKEYDMNHEKCKKIDFCSLMHNRTFVIGRKSKKYINCFAPFTTSLEEFHTFRAEIQNYLHNSNTHQMFWNVTNSVLLGRFLYENRDKIKF